MASAGSFFKNPLVSQAEAGRIAALARQKVPEQPLPQYPAENDLIKLSAAWLVEHSGFAKGQRKGGVGVSERHALALVNYEGTSAELLAFAQEIEKAVFERFGIHLDREPVVVA